MWVAFAFAAALVVTFLTRVRRALDVLERRAEESAKFAALGTLAAGAAHELATPLGTISILAAELATEGRHGDLREAATAIGAQVERCRAVLRRMHPGAEKPGRTGDAILGASVTTAVDSWRAAHPSASVIVECSDDVVVPLSPNDLEAALSVLLDNALFAIEKSGGDSPIVVTAQREADGARMTVTDCGAGVPAELSNRIGEPFLTTKEPGEGMGLGLYLLRTLLEEVGGRLEIEENVPHGTRVSLHLRAMTSNP
jgi:two-component system sensor histidine kinase RegB